MTRRQMITLIALALAAGCSNDSPRALVRGEDSCAYCRMTIDDLRFGALVLSDRGKLQTFDSIECAANWVAAQLPDHAPRAIWVANFTDPSQWVDANNAVFLHGSQIRSPMGRDLVAFAANSDGEALQRAHGGSVIDWAAVRELVATPQESPDAGAANAHSH